MVVSYSGTAATVHGKKSPNFPLLQNYSNMVCIEEASCGRMELIEDSALLQHCSQGDCSALHYVLLLRGENALPGLAMQCAA